MDLVSLIGFAAAFGTTTAFAPQAFKAWKSKHTKDISLIMFLLLTSGIFLWLIYGILIYSIPIILANAFSLILALFILYLKLKYG